MTTEGRVRLSCRSLLEQTSQWQPIIGMPALVPEPRKMSSIRSGILGGGFVDVTCGTRVFSFTVRERVAEIVATLLRERFKPRDDLRMLRSDVGRFGRIGLEIEERLRDLQSNGMAARAVRA